MSSSAIRSSIENSPWSATISVRRSSPKPCASSESSSLRIFRRRGFDPRISLHSLMNFRTSLSSSSSLVISRAEVHQGVQGDPRVEAADLLALLDELADFLGLVLELGDLEGGEPGEPHVEDFRRLLFRQLEALA